MPIRLTILKIIAAQRQKILRERRDVNIISNSRLFDVDFYRLKANISSKQDAIRHYCRAGWRSGINPSPYFDAEFYLKTYADVRSANVNPLRHYLTDGALELRHPTDSFEPAAFWKMFPDLYDKNASAAEVCLGLFGSYDYVGGRQADLVSVELLSACRLEFDESFYTSTYPDVDFKSQDAFLHFMNGGWSQWRNPHPNFDTFFYKNYAMAPAGLQNPLIHYAKIGKPAGVRTCAPARVIIDPADAPVPPPSLTVAIHAHVYYPDLLPELITGFQHLPSGSHLILTVVSEADATFVRTYLAQRGGSLPADILTVENRGRDIRPFFETTHLWSSFDLVLHLHTKRSPHLEWGDHWRRYLLDQLLGSRDLVASIVHAFAADPDLGMLYPDNFHRVKPFTIKQEEAGPVAAFRSRLGLEAATEQLGEFAAGSMAWFRTAAIAGSCRDVMTFDPFEKEIGQVNATFAHAAERLLPLFCESTRHRVSSYTTRVRPRLALASGGPAPMTASAIVGTRWTRDTPGIARQPPLPLAPTTWLHNPRSLDIHWVVPSFAGPGAGGHMTIFRIVSYLERFGHRQTIWLQNAFQHADPAEALTRVRAWYQPVGRNVHLLFLPDDVRELSGDIVIATDCWTAFPVAAATDFKVRFYFIQDDEPSFHPAGENQLIASLTYTFGFSCLCAGTWLHELATGRGQWSRPYDLSADRDVYLPRTGQRDRSGSLKIAFYARAHTSRRAVGLGLAALDELHRRGVAFEVHAFGEPALDLQVDYPIVDYGIVTPADLNRIYQECDVGLVFSATNYSLVPLEMMACGLPVVELDVPSTRAIFRNDEVAFAQPAPYAVADAIVALARDPIRVEAQVERAFQFLAPLSWENSARAVEAALLDRLVLVGSQPVDPTTVMASDATGPVAPLPSPALIGRPDVSVFIPTYNAGPAFDGVLNAIVGQHTDFRFDVLVIDSGSGDETCDIVRRYRDRGVALETIPKANFQHGRTRNLGIAHTEGRHVAILTQDALPADDSWLSALVGGFKSGDRVAGVTGRHLAYPQHDVFTQRDMCEHFDGLAMLPSPIDPFVGLPSHIYPGSQSWRMLSIFYSDNNSAMARDAWKILPYPELDWGEDQVWAREALRLGFQKAYAHDAAVYHSHAFTEAVAFGTAETEGAFWATHFGIDLHADPAAAIRAMNARDQAYAIEAGVPSVVLAARLRSNKVIVDGRHAGWAASTRPVMPEFVAN